MALICVGVVPASDVTACGEFGMISNVSAVRRAERSGVMFRRTLNLTILTDEARHEDNVEELLSSMQ